VKDGRFGPYVTDGETNASLRKGDTIEGITIERAAELLQIRRDAGPAKKGRTAPAKKAAARKKAAKKTTKKATKAGSAAKKAATRAPATGTPATTIERSEPGGTTEG
jgi:DNA topoisomerase-1